MIQPIEPKKLQYDTEKKGIFVVVDDEDYPIVIGKKGTNARLNAELTGVSIEVKKMSEYKAELSFEKQKLSLKEDSQLDVDLEQVKGLNPFVIESLKESGFDTPRKILCAPIDEIVKKTGVSVEMAQDIVEKIQKTRT